MRLFYDNDKIVPEQNSSASSDKLEGIIGKVIYNNEENAYAVCELELPDDTYTIIEGYMPMPAEGDSVCVYGKWVMNPKYGKQFRVEQYERVLPKSLDDIQKYLGGGAIKGIGPVSATKIVEKFGDQTFDVLENHPEWLADIPGISRKKALAIGEEYKKKSSMRDVMIFFREFFGMSIIMRIYKRFGKNSIKIARENPYLLFDEVDGIGYEKADRMALKLGMSPFAGERIRANVIHTLDVALNGYGHMCLPLESLCSECAENLGVESETVLANVGILLSSSILKMHTQEGVKYVYLKDAYRAERNVAKRLRQLNRQRNSVLTQDDINALITKQEFSAGMEYALKQKRAIHEAMQNGIMVMTGGPGTGKTTVVKALLSMFESIHMNVALCAPTGRAAMRLSEATSHSAKTIHRLLEMEFHEDGGSSFMRNLQNPLDEEVIIVDEASMVDCMLMNSLLSAMKNSSRLILIGDADQLPSVGGGNVLGDIIDSGEFSVVCLDEIFRQAKESLIITNAHEINNGNMPVLDRKDGDFFFLESDNETVCANTVVSLVETRLPKAYGVSPVNDIQILSPTKKGTLGTINLNYILQNRLNPADGRKKEYAHGANVFREGDKVMQVKNNYDISWNDIETFEDGNGIFNGDVGVIESISPSDGFMTIVFDKRKCDYDFSFLDDLSPAYAITVHKSQGSEYPFVIIPLANATRMLLTRNLLYTAVTRARRMVILVGSRKNVAVMVENNNHAHRYTCLKFMLRDAEV